MRPMSGSDSEVPEGAFHNAMLDIYDRAKRECGYNAARFRQMVMQHGGVEAARMLLASNQPSDGLTDILRPMQRTPRWLDALEPIRDQILELESCLR